MARVWNRPAWAASGLVAIGLLGAQVAAGADRPVVGIADPRFSTSYPAAALGQLAVDQVEIWVSPGDEAAPWAIPETIGVLVVFAGDHWYESHPASYAAAARRLVTYHPNIREIQVQNEPDLCLSWFGFWSTCLAPGTSRTRFSGAALDTYLDELAATHDALAGTGVKVLGFGFSPPWHHRDRGLFWWDPQHISDGIDSWYARRGGRTIVCVGPREANECVSVRVHGERYSHPIMDGFAYHPYAGWQDEETSLIHNSLEALELPGGTPGLWWTEFGMDTAGGTNGSACPWRGHETDQARLVDAVLRTARASPWVSGAFNFLLTDESDPMRFQTGLLRPDGSVKPAFSAFRAAAAS